MKYRKADNRKNVFQEMRCLGAERIRVPGQGEGKLHSLLRIHRPAPQVEPAVGQDVDVGQVSFSGPM